MSALIQQTEEWLEFRKNKIGASDAPVIMEVSPWNTPYELWLEKIGQKKNSKATKPQERGLLLEDIALAHFTLETGISMQKDVILHPSLNWMMASLDGISEKKDFAVEIKCPGKVDHAQALSGKIPDKYFPQLQHQLEVTGLEMIYYFSFDGLDGILLKHYRMTRF